MLQLFKQVLEVTVLEVTVLGTRVAIQILFLNPLAVMEVLLRLVEREANLIRVHNMRRLSLAMPVIALVVITRWGFADQVITGLLIVLGLLQRLLLIYLGEPCGVA